MLKNEPEDNVSIVAIGPLTNIAKAAQHDPKTFSKRNILIVLTENAVRELIIMGGTLIIPGNVTPVAGPSSIIFSNVGRVQYRYRSRSGFDIIFIHVNNI